MKLRSLETINSANVGLQNRQYTVIGLTADEIPERKQPAIQEFLKGEILKYRNFFPGDLSQTIEVFNDVHGGYTPRGAVPILLVAVQSKVDFENHFDLNLEGTLEEWLANNQQVVQELVAREEIMGPILCLPELCPYQQVFKPHALQELRLVQEARIESLESVLDNLKHLMYRLLDHSKGHQQILNQHLTDILTLLNQSDDE